MTTDKKLTEDTYLQALATGKNTVSIWLCNGVRLEGKLHSSDIEAVFLEPHGGYGEGLMLVMKAQISSIMPTSKRPNRSTVCNFDGVMLGKA